MLFSDMQTGGKILPNYDILVFDEAHESAGIFRDFDSDKLSINNATNLRNKATEVNNIKREAKPILDMELFKTLIKYFEIAFNDIDAKYKDLSSAQLIYGADELPTSFKSLSGELNIVSSHIDEMGKKQNSLLEYISLQYNR